MFGATGGVMDAALRSAYYLVTGENPDPDAFTAVRGMDGWKEASFTIPTAGEVKVAVVSGLGNARKLLYALERGEVSYDFVEVMACPGGCAGGGGQPLMTGRSWRRHAAACSGGSTRAKRCAFRTKIPTCRRSIATISASPSERNRIICSTPTIWHGRCRRRREDNKQAKSAANAALFRIFIFLQITVAFCGFCGTINAHLIILHERGIFHGICCK